MYGFRLLIEYICSNPNCKLINLFPLRETITDLGELKTITERHNQGRCYVCDCGMRVKRVTVSVMPKEFFPYGDPKHSSWQCPKKCLIIDKVYPLPLQYAVKDLKEKLSKKQEVWPSVYFSKYENIAKLGFPWKCPDCLSELEYLEDKIIRHG